MKTFYVISALNKDSSQLGNLKRHDTQSEAILHAKEVVELRRREQRTDMEFYVLKVVAKVGTEKAPIKVEKVK